MLDDANAVACLRHQRLRFLLERSARPKGVSLHPDFFSVAGQLERFEAAQRGGDDPSLACRIADLDRQVMRLRPSDAVALGWKLRRMAGQYSGGNLWLADALRWAAEDAEVLSLLDRGVQP